MNLLRAFLLVFSVLPGLALAADRLQTSAGEVLVEERVSGLWQPWAIAFLPDDELLITLRGGDLIHVDGDGTKNSVAGVPEVVAEGQGGLLDLVLARDFAETRELFLSYAMPMQRGAGTALAVARLSTDASRLEDVRVIFQMSEGSGREIHFGSRIAELPDGTILMAIGDRGARGQAQNLDRHNGKVIRVARDGSIPADNPFANGGGLPEIWSYGHRNPQGAALDTEGNLWTAEHGARGGDEVNQPKAGRNYGWPIISYGRHYTGLPIGEGVRKEGMEQPAHYWDPSIAPSGLMIYSGRLFPEWAGDVFVGSLKFDMISRLERSGERAEEVERLFQDRFLRIRDVREAPDGSIWFLSVGDNAAYRVTPAS